MTAGQVISVGAPIWASTAPTPVMPAVVTAWMSCGWGWVMVGLGGARRRASGLLEEHGPHGAVFGLEQLPKRNGLLGIAGQCGHDVTGQFAEWLADSLEMGGEMFVGEELQQVM